MSGSRVASWLVVLALWSSAAVAQEGSESESASESDLRSRGGGEVSGGVAFEHVDQATVRVFAVRHVEMTSVAGARQRRLIALPESGHGSGVVVDPRGVIATAKHVVDDMRHLAVRLPGPDGAVLPATVAYADDELDFALLLVATETPLPAVVPLPEVAAVLAVRTTVDAVGYPLDADRDHPQSSRGIISGSLDDGHLQLDIAVNPGNSGGPLLSEERLVGLVVARGNVEAGVQGIGIAVPIAPVRAAYDRIRRDGTLRRAYHRLRETLEEARRIAVVVDGIVRLGGVELLIEAADFVDDPSAGERIDRFMELAEHTSDPDLLALLSAYFWDAMQVMLERAGAGSLPSTMERGPARHRARVLHELAQELARRAVDADSTIRERSPFIRYMVDGPSVLDGSYGVLPTARRPRRKRLSEILAAPDWDQPRWRMVTLLGLLISLGPPPEEGAPLHKGSGVQFTTLFPFTKLDPDASVRFAPFLGLSVDLFGWATRPPVYWFTGPELGVMLRAGRRGGVSLMAAWSPGAFAARVVTTCGTYLDGEPIPCPERRRVGTIAMFHLGLFAKAGAVHLGLTLRTGRAFSDDNLDRYLTIAPTIGGNF